MLKIWGTDARPLTSVSDQSVSDTTFIFRIGPRHDAEICSRSMETGSTRKNLPAFVHHKAFCVTDIKPLFCTRILVFVDGNSIQHMFFSNSVVMDKVEMNTALSGVRRHFPKTPMANLRDETRRGETEGYCVLVFVESFESCFCFLHSSACRGWRVGGGGVGRQSCLGVTRAKPQKSIYLAFQFLFITLDSLQFSYLVPCGFICKRVGFISFFHTT